MIWITRAHTIQNACKTGLMLVESDWGTEPEWMGLAPKWEEFKKLESDPELL